MSSLLTWSKKLRFLTTGSLKGKLAFVTAPSIGKNKYFHVFMFEVAANLRVGILGGYFFIESGETA